MIYQISLEELENLIIELGMKNDYEYCFYILRNKESGIYYHSDIKTEYSREFCIPDRFDPLWHEDYYVSFIHTHPYVSNCVESPFLSIPDVQFAQRNSIKKMILCTPNGIYVFDKLALDFLAFSIRSYAFKLTRGKIYNLGDGF